MAEELIGVARYAGLFSPAMMTTIFGSASRTGILIGIAAGFSCSSLEEFLECFL
jgi:hypothetical protein